MIGSTVRTGLTVAAYCMIVLGFARGIELVYPFVVEPHSPSPYDAWTGVHHAAWSVVGGIVQAGILLALLSIDKRIQNRSV